jgi:predicted lipid-binding transport protein (Tim44 family)
MGGVVSRRRREGAGGRADRNGQSRGRLLGSGRPLGAAMTIVRKLIALASAAALVAALAACGETDLEQAREVAQDYVEASNEGDFEAVCDLYSQKLIEQLATPDCPAFVEENSSGTESELELVDVRVGDEVATVDIDIVSEGGGPIRVGLRMEREGDDWRIISLQ